MRYEWRTSTAAGALLLLLAAPAAADWLVTRDGGRIETRGTWKVKGKLVVFTQADGTLGSMRLAEVDLEASERVTTEEQLKSEAPAPPSEAAPRKKSVRSLTDADFAKAQPAPAAEEAQGDKEGEKKEAVETKKPAGKVEVASWRKVERTERDGLEVFGTLRNTGGDIAAGLGVTVKLYNEAGELLATGEGVPTNSSIKPQGVVNFRVAFPGVFTFSDVKFEVRSWGLDLEPAPTGK